MDKHVWLGVVLSVTPEADNEDGVIEAEVAPGFFNPTFQFTSRRVWSVPMCVTHTNEPSPKVGDIISITLLRYKRRKKDVIEDVTVIPPETREWLLRKLRGDDFHF